NKAKGEIGFPAATGNSVFFINQWVDEDESTRSIVNERRGIPSSWTDDQKSQLLRQFKESNSNAKSSVVHLPAGADLEYFVAFTGPEGGIATLEKSAHKYVIVIMD